MAKVFFGFALTDSMFDAHECNIERRILSVDEVTVKIAQGVLSCCNPSHEATIGAMRQRFNLNVEIPASPHRVELGIGDSVIVVSVRGLSRLTDRHEYTDNEVAKATFVFSEFTVSLTRVILQGFTTNLIHVEGG